MNRIRLFLTLDSDWHKIKSLTIIHWPYLSSDIVSQAIRYQLVYSGIMLVFIVTFLTSEFRSGSMLTCADLEKFHKLQLSKLAHKAPLKKENSVIIL